MFLIHLPKSKTKTTIDVSSSPASDLSPFLSCSQSEYLRGEKQKDFDEMVKFTATSLHVTGRSAKTRRHVE